MAEHLSKTERAKLPAESFAVPGKRALPIHDAKHVKMAWSQLSRTQGLTPSERKSARARIMMKAHELGIDTSGWEVHAVSYCLDAMAIEMPDVPEHPNRMPFHGVLTRVDEPSDNPPEGSGGHRTLIPANVAEAAIPSLLGMGVDFTEKFDGHDRRKKIGLITAAEVKGNAIEIAGFLYAADFPDECARIKSEKDQLGFSYECQAAIADPDADPWLVTRCTFTGAAVLYKHLAAYTTTSLAAKAEQEFDMTKEELEAALAASIGAALKPLNDQITVLAGKVDKVEKTSIEAAAVRDRVKPHAEAIRSCAAAMEAAGIGTHATRGHVNTLRHMAASMEADAAMGNVPHIYRDHDYLTRTMDAGADKGGDEVDVGKAVQAALKPVLDQVAGLGTQVKDLSAKAFDKSPAPERKTISPDVAKLLAKFDLTAAANDGKLTIADVDKALSGLPTAQRIEQKLKLEAAGVIAKAA